MAAENDHPDWLPTPPPSRPARRDAAIEAAMRKFDGVEDAPVARPTWVRTHRTQLSVAFSAMLLVIVGVPAALIGLRNQPAVPDRSPPPPAVRYSQPKPAAKPMAIAPAQNMAVAPLPQSVTPPALRKNRGDEAVGAVRDEPVEAKAADVVASAPVVAAPPPPAPPPPPPPPPVQIASAEQMATSDVVVTGSRLEQRAPSRQAAPSSRSFSVFRPAPKTIAPPQSSAAFLSRLQGAVRSNDRAALIGMIAFPLRVNHHERSKVYRDAASVSRDFDRIFSARVRQAILSQRPELLFSRDVGTMIGNGELWFEQSCADARCSALGPVRIIAVNP